MNSETRWQISAADMAPPSEDRFDRFRLMPWWDQTRMAQAKVLVIGAGALGNELIKNLALLGVGRLLVADLDRVENSNLSRSILFRETNEGALKAEVACRAAREIYPGIRAQSFVGNVIHDLGWGVFRWADLVLAGLDNREARLAINRACWRVNRPWIDGAIEQIQGVARLFVPDGPCYECTLSEIDWQLLQQRRSCNLLTRTQMEQGRTPTTPTISSIIAGVQCQEAVKWIHGLSTAAGKGWIFDGWSGEAYYTTYQQRPDCYSHDTLGEFVELNEISETLTVGALLDFARHRWGPETTLELSRDVVGELICPHCQAREACYQSLSRVTSTQALCPGCGETNREVHTFYQIHGTEPFLDRSLAQLGIPSWDIITAVARDRRIGLELKADAARILGTLEDEDSPTWI